MFREPPQGTSFPSRRTVHRLSQRSISQNRDAFLFFHFAAHNFELRVGLDTSRHKLGIATFYRWIDMLDNFPDIEFEVWRLKVKRFDVFCYSAERNGSPLPRSSTELLSPGDYGAYSLRTQVIVDYLPAQFGRGDPEDIYVAKEIGFSGCFSGFAKQLEKTKSYSEEDPLAFDQDSFTEDIKASTKARDGGVCFIQGVSANNTELAWIVPPTLAVWAYIAVKDSDCPFDLANAHRNFDNCITLEESLLEHFLENKFGVDVEDDYKIIIFQDFPGSEKLAANPRLPSASIQSLNDNSRLYLRENFKYCLGVNLMGGDISEDYADLGEEFFDKVGEEDFNPKDEKWKTPIGQEYLDFYKDQFPEFQELLL